MSEDGLKDCPQCGMERIPRRVRLCTACEVDERWGAAMALKDAELASAREALAKLLREVEKSGNAEATDFGWPAAVAAARAALEGA